MNSKIKPEKVTALEQYEAKQAEITKLLKQIAVGLQEHDRSASGDGGHNWEHVGDLSDMVTTLTDIRDRLHHTGEYAEVHKTYRTYDRSGKTIKVTIP